MNEIKYRPLEKKDYESALSIINNSFGLYRYVDNGKMLKYLLRSYLHSCLSEQTYTCVAEKDGKVIGLILGQAKSEYNAIKHMPHFLKFAYYNVAMMFQAVIFGNKNKDLRKMHHVYSELIEGKEKEFDGVLTLFAVSEECRGFGVGKRLLSELTGYLKSHNTTNIYLYTDSTCNVGFYESQGFERFGERAMQITSDNKKKNLDVFVYKYEIK